MSLVTLQTESLVAPVANFVKHIVSEILINPPEIITINDQEFKVNMTKMKTNTPYFVDFMDSRYIIWKNKNKSLVINEVA